MKSLQQAVVLCGGLGTRLRPYTDSMPKPMVPVHGRPFLEYLLEQMAAHGIRKFLLLTGYLGTQISDYFGNGNLWGWEIDYSHGPAEWETGRRFWEARQKMETCFLLLYSDNFVQLPMDRLIDFHVNEQLSLSLLLAPKVNGNVRVSAKGRIEAYDEARVCDMNFVEVGYMLIERDRLLKVVGTLKNFPNMSFSEVLRWLVHINEVGGIIIQDPYHSISDPARLELMQKYLKPKKIILIDRDGVINKKAAAGEYIDTWEKFEWIYETRQAMKELAMRGFEFIVISNQAGVARGMVNPVVLEQIHQNMIEVLHRDGIKILDVYVCPHHWDIICDCRKPKPGMFFRASRDHLFRMDQTIFIGDDVRDCLAAYNAGCGSILIGQGCKEKIDSKAEPLLRVEKLSDAVSWLNFRFHDKVQKYLANTEIEITSNV